MSEVVNPQAAAMALLPGAQFADAYRSEFDGPPRDARTIAELAVGRSPAWVDVLLRLRNRMALFVGLKIGENPKRPMADSIGMFPVVTQTDRQVVLGFDDRHLDFRILVDVDDLASDRQAVTATTVVKTHNIFGRAYLALVMPFHRRIVPAMLEQARAG